MDRSRRENRENREITFQYKSRHEALLDEELIEDKLTQLLAFVEQLERTSTGAAGIQRRIKLLGECKRSEGETSAEFYSRLKRWLDWDMPPKKSPLHAPRQTEGDSSKQ
jgi:hypothetical protein